MDELQRRVDAQADQLDREYEALMRLLDDGASEETIRLMVGLAKRVQRHTKLVIQALAQMRDHLQP